MEDKTKLLYDKLSEQGLYTKSFDEFTTQFSDPSKRELLHSALGKQGLYTKTYEEFNAQFFPEVKKKDLTTKDAFTSASGKEELPFLGQSGQNLVNPQDTSTQPSQSVSTEPTQALPTPEQPKQEAKTVGEWVLGTAKAFDKSLAGVADAIDYVQTSANDALNQIIFGKETANGIKKMRENGTLSPVLNPIRPFEAISDAINYSHSGAKPLPTGKGVKGVAGDILSGTAGVVPDILASIYAPEVKLPSMFNKLGLQVGSKFGMVMGAKSAIEGTKQAEGGTVFQKVEAPILGAIEGYMTGWMFDGIGERSAKIGENIANKIFPNVTTHNQAINKALTQQGGSMLSNAVFFGGYGNAEEYLRTGQISPETFATNAGMGIALGIREPAKLLFAKGMNAFIATPKEVINRLANDPIQTEDYTKKAEEKISAIENGTTTDREGDLALAKINANLANLNAIVDEIRDNKDEVTKIVKDSELEPKAKEIIIDKINEVDADNDPKVQATKDVNDKIAKIDEQLETIKSNKSWDDARKEVESAPLKEQKQALKDEAVSILSKPIETEFKLGDKSFKLEKELTDWLDKNYNEEDRFTSVNEDGYLEPNTMKVFNKWYKENKPRLAQEHLDKIEQARPPKDVTFIGKQEGETPEESLDLYNVKVGENEATFAVPSGSGRDIIEAKKQQTIDKFKIQDNAKSSGETNSQIIDESTSQLEQGKGDGNNVGNNEQKGVAEEVIKPVFKSNKEVGTAFTSIFNKLGRSKLEGILDNWNESRLSPDGDKIISNPYRRNAVKGKEMTVTSGKKGFIEWLLSDAPFDEKVYGKNILKDTEWVNDINEARKAIGYDVKPAESKESIPLGEEKIDNSTGDIDINSMPVSDTEKRLIQTAKERRGEKLNLSQVVDFATKIAKNNGSERRVEHTAEALNYASQTPTDFYNEKLNKEDGSLDVFVKRAIKTSTTGDAQSERILNLNLSEEWNAVAKKIQDAFLIIKSKTKNLDETATRLLNNYIEFTAGNLDDAVEMVNSLKGNTSEKVAESIWNYSRAKEIKQINETPWYHGTNADFTEFSTKNIGKTDEGWWGQGVYFHTDSDRGGYGGIVKQVVPNLKKPFIIPSDNRVVYDLFAKELKLSKELKDKSDQAVIKAIGSKEFTNVLKKYGYDGVVVEYAEGTRELVVFNPRQITIKNQNINESAPKSSLEESKPSLTDNKVEEVLSKGDEIKAKQEVVKGKIADNLDNLMSAIGGIKNITGEQRVKVLSELADLAKNIAELTSLKGEQLWNEVKKYLDEKKITLPDDLISEAKTGIIDTYAEKTTEKGREVSSENKIDEKSSGDKNTDGDLKRAGFEKRQTNGSDIGSVEKRTDEVGEIVKKIVDKNPHFYTEMHAEEVIQSAKDLIAGEGSIDNAYAKLVKRTRDMYENGENTLPIIHVARQILMQHYGEQLRDLNKMNDKKGADKLADRIIELEDITQKEVRIAGRTSAFTLWSMLNPEASVFMVEKIIRDINRTKLGFEGQEAIDFLDKWNNEVPDAVQRLLSENKDLKDTIDKLQARIDKGDNTPQRTTKIKAKELATKVRSLKSTNWGLTFSDPSGAVVILDGALELTAKTIETTGNIIQAINDGVSQIKKSKWYRDLAKEKQKEVEDTFRGRVRKEVEFDATDQIESQSWFKEAQKEPTTEEQKAEKDAKKDINRQKREANDRLKDSIYDVIASHLLVPKDGGESLADKLKNELGLTQSEANKIADIALKSFKDEAQKVFDKSLGIKIKKESKRKTTFEQFFGLIKKGVLNSDNYAELFAEKYGIKKGLTTEEKSELLRLGMNAEAMKPYGLFGELATNEFLQYMAKITKADTWLGRQTKLMVLANYARMLSGITTHIINVSTAGANVVVDPLIDVVNPNKVGRYLRAFVKGDKIGMALNNPLARTYYAYGKGGAYNAGSKIGLNQALNIVKHGDTKMASKYMESVQNKKGDVIPELEKNTYGEGMRFKGGKWNPFNLMKYSARTLLAEDSWTYNIPFALELAMAARADAIKNGTKLSGSELRKKLIDEIQGTFLTEEQTRDVEQQLSEQIRLLEEQGITPDEGQVKQRRFELTRSLLDLSAETLESAEQLARGNNFTDQRGGVFSQLSESVGRAVNKNIGWKLVTMTKVPFTTVVGRIADFTLDTMYGAVRAHGVSPTGLVARGRAWAKTGNFSSFKESPQSFGEFKSAQLGEKGSERYEQQMRRQWAGVITMGLSYALFMGSDDDDDKDKWDITGELASADTLKKQKHPLGAYTIRIPLPFTDKAIKFRYVNYPIINFPLSILGNYKDHKRQGVDEDTLNAKLGLSLHAWFHSMTMLKDTSLASGIGELVDLIGGIFSSVKGKSEGEKLKDTENGLEQPKIDKRVTQELATIRDEYTQLPLRYIDPIKSNFIQQIWKGITPAGRLQGKSTDLLMYNLGLQNINNDKRTDIFGQEVKVYPGDAGIAWPREDDERWQKMWKYNINISDITAKDRVVADGKYRTLEWDEFLQKKEKTNMLFKDAFDEYFKKYNKEELDARAKRYTTDASGNKTNEIDSDLNKIWATIRNNTNRFLFSWNKQVEKEPKLMNLLLNEGLLPNFYNEKMVLEDKELIPVSKSKAQGKVGMIIPFTEVKELNDNAMAIFLKNTKYLLNKDITKLRNDIDPETGKSTLQDDVNEEWNSALDDAKEMLRKKMVKTSKGK